MIERVTGRLIRRSGTALYVEAGAFTLEILVTPPTSEGTPPEGDLVELWTHLQWKEDGPTLFGFTTPEERTLFRRLIQVQGVGPRIALAILAHLPPAELVRQIRAKAEEGLTRVPGVGKKTAGRILVELGPQAEKLELAIGTAGGPATAPLPDPGVMENARQALTALGYPPAEAKRVLGEVLRADPELSLDEQIRRALRLLAGNSPRSGR